MAATAAHERRQLVHLLKLAVAEGRQAGGRRNFPGSAFGFGWQPCLGSILASVSAVAATSGSAGQGAALLSVYSLGLGIPFLIVGLALGRLSGTLSFVRRHSRVITICSVVVMGVFGLLLFTDRLTDVTSELETVMRSIGLGGLVTAG